MQEVEQRMEQLPSRKLKAGGKKRAQGRLGRASAETAWRKIYCEEVDFAYLVRIQRVHFKFPSGLVSNPGYGSLK